MHEKDAELFARIDDVLTGHDRQQSGEFACVIDDYGAYRPALHREPVDAGSTVVSGGLTVPEHTFLRGDIIHSTAPPGHVHVTTELVNGQIGTAIWDDDIEFEFCRTTDGIIGTFSADGTIRYHRGDPGTDDFTVQHGVVIPSGTMDSVDIGIDISSLEAEGRQGLAMTIGTATAEEPDRASYAERAEESELSVTPERAEGPESTFPRERAVLQERTTEQERAESDEGTVSYEPLDTDDDEWIPIADILGTDTIPRTAAAIILAAITHMLHEGTVSPHAPWQAIEYFCADYLAGADE